MKVINPVIYFFYIFTLIAIYGCESNQSSAKSTMKTSKLQSEEESLPIIVPEQCRQRNLPQKNLPQASIQLKTKNEILNFTTDIAQTDSELQIGLMCKKNLRYNHAMLFVFPDERPRSFWMKNTLISLDLLFINRNFEIIHIEKNAKPLSLDNLRSYHPAQYVLEIKAGFSTKKQIQVGHRIKILK